MFDKTDPARGLSLFCTIIYIVAVTIGAFTGGLWAALGIALALVAFFTTWLRDKKPPSPSKIFALFALIALALFAAELPASSQPDLSAKFLLRLASIFLPLVLLTSKRLQAIASSSFFIPATALAASLGALALGCELFSGGALLHAFKKPQASLTEYNRGAAHLVILAFPLFAGLWLSGKRTSALLLAVLLLFPSSLTESRTAKLALLVGVACSIAALYRPLWVRRLLSLVAVVLMPWPLYAQAFFSYFPAQVEKLPPSWQHRIEIWDYLSYRICERPLFGWGLGTTHTLDVAQPHGNLYKYATEAAPHAHNFITQLWVETGVVGLALGLAFLLLTLRAAFKLHPGLRPFALGGWAAAVTVSMFGFDFWTDALWAAFALSAFVFGMLQQRLESGKNLIGV